MQRSIEDRTIELANYIIENKCTVRDAAKKFGISKSTVHTEGVTLKVFISKWRNDAVYGDFIKSQIFRAYLYKNRKYKNPELQCLSGFQDFSVSVLLSLYRDFEMCAKAFLFVNF